MKPDLVLDTSSSQMCAYMYACVCVYMYIGVCLCICVSVCMYWYMCICVYMCIGVCICAYICLNTERPKDSTRCHTQSSSGLLL